MTRSLALLTCFATACAAGRDGGGCGVSDGLPSAIAFVVVLATMLRVLSLRDQE